MGLTTPALLPNSPEQEGPPVFIVSEKLVTCFAYSQKDSQPLCYSSCFFMHLYCLIRLHLLLIYEILLAFCILQSFYWILVTLSVTSWHPLVNRPDLDTLPMIHIYAMFVAGGFLLKKNMKHIGYSIRICYQCLILWP